MGFGYNAIHGNAAPTKTKRVFLRTGTAKEGFAVCYNFDAVGVDAENNALTTSYGRALGTTLNYYNDARRLMVEPPNYQNGIHFAGVVAHESHDVEGPNWITIHEPGSICKIYAVPSAGGANLATALTHPYISTGASGSAQTTAAALHILNYTISCTSARASIVDGEPYMSGYNGQFCFPGMPGAGAAICLEAAVENSADTAWDQSNLIMAELMEGPPSGGVQTISFGSSVSSIVVNDVTDDHWESILTPFGVSRISVGGTKPSNTTLITLLGGTFVGQRKLYHIPAIAAGTNIGLEHDHFMLGAGFSSQIQAAATGFDALVTSLAIGSVANDYLLLDWNGVDWQVIAASTALNTTVVHG